MSCPVCGAEAGGNRHNMEGQQHVDAHMLTTKPSEAAEPFAFISLVVACGEEAFAAGLGCSGSAKGHQ